MTNQTTIPVTAAGQTMSAAESQSLSKATGLPVTTSQAAADLTLPSAAFKASFSRDFGAVNEADRARYVLALCKVLDIPTPLNPFYFLNLNGKTVLYSGIEAAQLLAESKKLSVEVRSKTLDEKTGIYTVEVRVTAPSGRFCDNEGAIHLGGLSGKDRANAQMKAVTKAQRRAILSFCGLSMTDDDDAQQGDYGRPANPLAERTKQILEDTQLAPEEQRQFVEARGMFNAAPEIIKNAAAGELRVPMGPAQAAGLINVNHNDPKEAAELKRELFKKLLVGAIAPFSRPEQAFAWVEATIGVKWDDLTAVDCAELLPFIDEEFFAAQAGK